MEMTLTKPIADGVSVTITENVKICGCRLNGVIYNDLNDDERLDLLNNVCGYFMSKPAEEQFKYAKQIMDGKDIEQNIEPPLDENGNVLDGWVAPEPIHRDYENVKKLLGLITGIDILNKHLDKIDIS